MTPDLKRYGLHFETIYYNNSVAMLYMQALTRKPENFLSSAGALIAYSGEKTGRSPKEKRIVEEETTKANVWWGPVNIPLPEFSFDILRDTAVAGLQARRDYGYVVDGFAGWDPKYRIKVRVLCGRAYHALFMRNMLIRPTKEELANFGEPDWVIYNSGHTKVSPQIPGVNSNTCIATNFKTQEMVILGTEYAGEMKKGIFTVLNYVLPLQGVLSMHCSANEGEKGDTALFFGLSGTGKTTLSADPKRRLIGDDEHGWSDDGIFNFEGGCYAKCINLSKEQEPEIFSAIRFGAIMENVDVDFDSGIIDYGSSRITENTRVSYPVEFIPNAKIPCLGDHPKNIIFLTCDAFGVLPPVSRLNPEQAMYHFISGYTAKVAGTEMGVTEPTATFSACFGAAFLVWHPAKYATLLAEKIRTHGSKVWLVNTGWTGGGAGVGHRMSLRHTRAIIDAILDGSLDGAPYATDPVFRIEHPTSCPNVPHELLTPRNVWGNKEAYDAAARNLAAMFVENMKKFADSTGDQSFLRGAPIVTS